MMQQSSARHGSHTGPWCSWPPPPVLTSVYLFCSHNRSQKLHFRFIRGSEKEKNPATVTGKKNKNATISSPSSIIIYIYYSCCSPTSLGSWPPTIQSGSAQGSCLWTGSVSIFAHVAPSSQCFEKLFHLYAWNNVWGHSQVLFWH